MEFMRIGDGVTVRRGAWISVLPGHLAPGDSPLLTIGDGSYLGNGCVISCVREVRIGRQVVFGDNVQVGDTSHRYQTPGKHLFAQGLEVGRLVIGDRAWIGRNSFVGHDLEIGEHAVVGANSVVTKSVPAYTVVAGSPARVLRRYDPATGAWPRV
jgi:acetyltransferase-like isoleucine patch superfamily enzyme